MNAQSFEQLQFYIAVIGVILAIGSFVSPIVFAAVLWKMSQMFVSKNDFASFIKQQEEKHQENKSRIEEIRTEIKSSLHIIENDLKEIFKKAQFKTS